MLFRSHVNAGSALQGGDGSRNGDHSSAGAGGGYVGGEGGYYNNTGPGAAGGGGASFMMPNIYPLGTKFSNLWPTIPSTVTAVNSTNNTRISSSRTNTNEDSVRAAGATNNGYVWILYLGATYPGDAESDWIVN